MLKKCLLMSLFWGVVLFAHATPAQAQYTAPWGELFFFPSTTYHYYNAYCFDSFGNVVNYCNVVINSGNYATTNGHSHTSPAAPHTSWSPTSGNTGCCGLALTHTTTQVGQAEWMDVCAFSCGRANFVVGYWDFQQVNQANYWVFVGATPQHPDNHWAKANVINSMQGVAIQYRGEYPTNPVIAINDESLMRGGIFDLNFNWAGPHFNHSRGTAFDVRGNGAANSIPRDPATQQRFMLICQGFGANIVLHENAGTTNEHFHCEWP